MNKNILTIILIAVLIGAYMYFSGSAPEHTLTEKTWTWQSTMMNNDEIITPKQVDAFTITFKDEKSLGGTTDCNNFFGQYEVDGNKIMFGPVGMTEMYCEGSQEMEFHETLWESEGYLFDEDGRLIFTLKNDSGAMIFE